MIYGNTEIFEKAGIAIPEKWTWEEFMSACKTIKDKTGTFPFVICSDPTVQTWMGRNGVLSIGKTENKLDALAEGQIPATDEMFSKILKNVKALYDAKYWYPGQGALTISRDEAKAAFFQGKVAMLAEVAATASAIIKDSKFKVAPIRWPSMGKESGVVGGCDGYFIPANAAHKEDSVKLLKVFLGDKIQKIHADAGFAVTNVNADVKDPVIKSIIELSSDVVTKEFFNLSPKIKDYVDKQLLPKYILGKSEKDVLSNLEKLRQEALKK